MPEAKNIICTKHVRDNIERKLAEIGVGRNSKTAFCQDIFGGKDKEEGLINAMDCASFDEQLSGLEKEWKDRELASGINRPSTFFDYFRRHVAADMKTSMISPVREMAGVAPGKVYFNNDNESVNAKIKKFVQRKRNDWPSFVSAMKELISMQSRNVDRAVFNEGPYRLTQELATLGVSSDELTMLSSKERKAFIKRFNHFEPICHLQKTSRCCSV